MDSTGNISVFKARISRPLLLIAAGFFSAYLIPLVFCFLYLLQEIFSFLRFAEFSIYYTVFLIELSSAIILMLPVIGGIWISRKMKGQHIPWRYTLPFIVVFCMIGVCDILQSYYSFSTIRDLPAALFIFQIMVLLILPATGWYLLKGLQKTVGDISQAQTRIVTGIGIAGIVSLAFCLSISLLPLLSQMVSGTASSYPSGKFFPVSNADWLLWYCFNLIFSFVLFPVVGIQFLRLRRGYRNNQAETAPMTGERIPGKNHSALILTIALILSVLLLTGGYLMIGCTGGILAKNTCQEIVASITAHPANTTTHQMSIPPLRYYNIYQKYWILVDPLILNRKVGENLSILATTNMPVGEEVRCVIKSGTGYDHLKNESAATITVHVTAGENGTNAIICPVDTTELVPERDSHGQPGSLSQFELALDEQAVWLGARNRTFILLDAPVWYISFDPISDKQYGDVFTVNSTTNIPSGKMVNVHMNQWFGDKNPITEPQMIFPGNDGPNYTSFIVNTSIFHPVEYDKVNVAEEYDFLNMSFGGGTIFSISTHPPGSEYIRIADCDYDGPWTHRGGFSGKVFNITISSTTNLPEGKNIVWEVRNYPEVTDSMLGGTYLMNGTEQVIRGENGVNHTSLEINLLSMNLTSDGFIVVEKAKTGDVLGFQSCGQMFHP